MQSPSGIHKKYLEERVIIISNIMRVYYKKNVKKYIKFLCQNSPRRQHSLKKRERSSSAVIAQGIYYDLTKCLFTI